MRAEAWFRRAAALASLAVALGAFGAHALRETLERNGTTAVWQTAVFYHFIHALALFALAANFARIRAAAASAWLFLTGTAFFSGSLYLLAVTGQRWLGAITPLGGLCFLAGWAWLAWGGLRAEAPSVGKN
ncbi:MAG: DUF423 domain-containing protein [Verrucomicrobia bacterium]|nr:DUF423 domain-containing protein [Verrucomicrobiota bacterium]MBV9656985.1 DUF423 domain-containing protein [Verrucomicrobiota bacterium]